MIACNCKKAAVALLSVEQQPLTGVHTLYIHVRLSAPSTTKDTLKSEINLQNL